MVVTLLAGYPVMGGAIAVLFNLYRKAQEDRIREKTERLAQAEEHERVLKAMIEKLGGGQNP